jgi:hypothetical protein
LGHLVELCHSSSFLCLTIFGRLHNGWMCKIIFFFTFHPFYNLLNFNFSFIIQPFSQIFHPLCNFFHNFSYIVQPFVLTFHPTMPKAWFCDSMITFAIMLWNWLGDYLDNSNSCFNHLVDNMLMILDTYPLHFHCAHVKHILRITMTII